MEVYDSSSKVFYLKRLDNDLTVNYLLNDILDHKRITLGCIQGLSMLMIIPKRLMALSRVYRSKLRYEY